MNSRDAIYRIQKCKPPITKFKTENKNQMILPPRAVGGLVGWSNRLLGNTKTRPSQMEAPQVTPLSSNPTTRMRLSCLSSSTCQNNLDHFSSFLHLLKTWEYSVFVFVDFICVGHTARKDKVKRPEGPAARCRAQEGPLTFNQWDKRQFILTGHPRYVSSSLNGCIDWSAKVINTHSRQS